MLSLILFLILVVNALENTTFFISLLTLMIFFISILLLSLILVLRITCYFKVFHDIHRAEKHTISTASWFTIKLFCKRYKELCHTAIQGNEFHQRAWKCSCQVFISQNLMTPFFVRINISQADCKFRASPSFLG